jgi:hypothetical protein
VLKPATQHSSSVSECFGAPSIHRMIEYCGVLQLGTCLLIFFKNLFIYLFNFRSILWQVKIFLKILFISIQNHFKALKLDDG